MIHPLRAWRDKHDLPVRVLVEETGLTQPFICEIEKWVKEPSLSSAYKLSRATMKLSTKNGGLSMEDFVRDK